jgi:hypothetical protein
LAGLCNLELGKSDHRPICLDTYHLAGVAEQRPSYGRKFEVRWLAEETVEEVVKTAWRKAAQRGIGPDIGAKLTVVHQDLHAWDRMALKEPRSRLRKAQRELESLTKASPTSDVRMQQKELSLFIENLLEQDEIYWAQRGKVSWLRRGDRNTAYFHQFASARRWKNLIKKLKSSSDSWSIVATPRPSRGRGPARWR